MTGTDLRTRARGGDVAPNSGQVDLKAQIKAMESQFQLAMPKGVEAAQLVRDAMTVLSANPSLLRCDGRSVLGGLMTCAQLGLRPGVLGQAWIIPFKGKGQLIIGYQGLIALAQRSGDIKSITARMICENDHWDVEWGTEDRLVHKPFVKGDRGPVVAYYAVVKSTRGGTYWELMTRPDAEAHRDKFAMARKEGQVVGPWRDHFDAMALKTVLIRALKLAPRNTEIQRAIDVDDTIRVDVTPTAEPADVAWTPAAEIVEGEVDIPDDGEFDPTVEPGFAEDAR